jgi:ABC-type branched-subunit amino acid transport system ATPase component
VSLQPGLGEGDQADGLGQPPPGETAAKALLQAQGLGRDFGGVRAVDEVSFSVAQGTITGIIGPNGAGKSTVLGMLAGEIRPSRGTMRFDGRDLVGVPPHKAARAGIIRTFQLASVFSHLTVFENLLMGDYAPHIENLWASLAGRRVWRERERDRIDRAHQILEQFDMAGTGDLYAEELSGGQKRLVEIMRALMASPRLLLLDEPMAGVNRSIGARIEKILLQLRSQGMTVLMIEHELEVVERLCDPVIVMAQGRVLHQGTMEEIRSNHDVQRAYLVG